MSNKESLFDISKNQSTWNDFFISNATSQPTLFFLSLEIKSVQDIILEEYLFNKN